MSGPFERMMHSPRVELHFRHAQEKAHKFGKFLVEHPEIDANFVDDMTPEQEAAWTAYSSDLQITQHMELAELNLGQK